MISLAQLARHTPRFVKRVIGDSAIAKRLRELGMTDGALVEVLGNAPLGGALRIRLGTYQLALRTEEAAIVEITSG